MTMEKTATSAKRWVDRVVQALDADGVDVPPEVIEEFARQLLARASSDYLERGGPSRIADSIVSLLGFVQETGPDEIGVRVRRPEGGAHRLVVETVMPDCSFIVNTLREYVHGEDFNIVHLLHPVLVIERDDDGRVAGVAGRGADGPRTSIVHLLLDGHVEEGQPERMEAEIRRRLGLVRKATADFEAMMERCREVVEDLEEEKERAPWRAAELEEIREFLSWLQDGSFVFLGYRSYDLWADEEGRRWIEVDDGSGRGILRDEETSRYAEPKPLEELPSNLRARVLGGPLLIISKTNAESPVHRRARMDYLGVKRLGPDGEVVGERRFLGLFTAKAYAQDAATIPILRRKLKEILEAEEVARGSHDYNQILQIFNSMPKEELFLASVPELLKVIGAVMETEGADEVRVVPRSDPLARGLNVVVMLPRDRFSTAVRKQVQRALLEAYDGELLNYHLSMDGGDQARLHFYITSDLEEADTVDVRALEDRIRQSVRSWEERLTDALEASHDVERAHALSDRHRGDFTTEYKATVDVGTAVEDIHRLEALDETGLQQLALEPVDPDRPEASLVKVFAPKGAYVLSDLMPILENLGVRVIEADKFDVGTREGRVRTIHTFEVEAPADWGLERSEAGPRMVELLRAIDARATDDDRLNSLILSAGLTWRQVALLRAYAGYAFRVGAVASRAGVRRPLAEHPRVSRLLYRVFEALHDPERQEEGPEVERSLRRRFREALSEVRSIEHDRTFRRLMNLVRSTTRTNFFQERAREREGGMVALKFDCRQVEVMPEPRPRYEIYLNGGRTEGAHLRMGRVARGGIRWSDRSEDFRVEVLGLVKTQHVKNSVIVPAGAKGAYVVKDPPAEEAALRQAGVASYREFIRGLLDLTDNIVEGEVVHPPETAVRDGDDPYLVVAADKGTAHLSDTANELADEVAFWLGDAFASGGTHGYDHKELGITARGTWACVRRHFRELGVDAEEEPITVAGIGDMSGDVFGNGMLLSRTLELVAAFDHRHVFLDPDPDPEASFEERRRLFGMDRSSWDDYDREAISEGGGVWERGAKEIRLSPEARRLLDVEEETVNGEALVRAVLTADVDLLWNGGIGTYVKASDETHGEVGDPGNDDVRVDASDLRADVVGEGGNLGFTQRARVEYALRGGRINTDALDNSAGVDMSDHEVNLKILLRAALEEGRLDPADRNRLLAEVTDEVAADVLSNNYTQSLAVSLDEHRVQEVPAEFRDTLVQLEREGELDRALEDLPTGEELLERQEEGAFLTRPELAVLMAHAKNQLRERLRTSELPDDPGMRELQRSYFPEAVVEQVGEDLLDRHRLQRRIVASRLTNRFVDRMGATSHVELVRETGKSPARVVRAWYCACRVAEVDELYDRLRRAEPEVPAGVQIQWHLQISEVLERATRWLLTHQDPSRTVEETVRRYRGPVDRLRGALADLLRDDRRERFRRLQSLHETDGLEAPLAAELTTLQYLDGLLPVAELARVHGLDAGLVGEVYFGLAEAIDFPWLQDALDRVAGADLWEQRAARSLALELEDARTRMASRVVRRVQGPPDVERAMAEFREGRREGLERIRQVLEDVRAVERPNLSTMMVAVQAIRNQAGAGDGS
jgi:glutamate dehydrogenase